MVPGVKTGRFLSAKCSVTFSQLWAEGMNGDKCDNTEPPTALVRATATQAHQEKRGREHPPVLVHVDLLLDQLSVGALCFLLRHRHQLDQFRPEGQQHTRTKRFCTIQHKTTEKHHYQLFSNISFIVSQITTLSICESMK